MFRHVSQIALLLALAARLAAGSALGLGPGVLGRPQVESPPAVFELRIPQFEAASPRLEAPPASDAPARRRVYVLHSGIHTILASHNKNLFAEAMRDKLLKRGVAARDIVVLANPYPTARWFNMFPRQCLTWFMDSADPGSWIAQAGYARMDQALKKQGVGPDDDLVWIGHSAGGQMGLTVAYLAANHASYPGLASTSAYHFAMVITLGSPIVSNLLPPEIEVRHYLSPRDQLPRRMAQLSPPLLWMFGYDLPIQKTPPQLSAHCKVRLFQDIEHANWDVEERVADRILAEATPDYLPPWQVAVDCLAPGWAWLPGLCEAFDACGHVSIEDPPRVRR